MHSSGITTSVHVAYWYLYQRFGLRGVPRTAETRSERRLPSVKQDLGSVAASLSLSQQALVRRQFLSGDEIQRILTEEPMTVASVPEDIEAGGPP
jgi:hypothetical protein